MILENLDMSQLAILIPIGIAVVKGITNKFNVTNSLHKELITLLVALSTVAYLLYREALFMQVIAFIVVLYFGMTGIYSFIPQEIKNQDKVDNEIENENARLSIIATETIPDEPINVVDKSVDIVYNVDETEINTIDPDEPVNVVNVEG